MADWNKPALADTYANFLDYLVARDFDSISLCYSGHPTNPQTGMLSYKRSTDNFEEYNGAAWVDKLLALVGGGTGAATAAGARTNLGLGSIATQAASGVAITGGSITGLGTFTTSGAVTIGGGITAGSGVVGIVDATGKIPALSSTYLASLSGANLTTLNATNLSSGTVAPARLGTGSGGATKFLREDNTWQTITVAPAISTFSGTWTGSGGAQNFTISPALTDYTKAAVTYCGMKSAAVTTSPPQITLTSNTNASVDFGAQTTSMPFLGYVMQGS